MKWAQNYIGSKFNRVYNPVNLVVIYDQPGLAYMANLGWYTQVENSACLVTTCILVGLFG